MPCDRRALRGELQRARGFDPAARRAGKGDSPLEPAKLSMVWLSGEVMAEMHAMPYETVGQVKSRLAKTLPASSGCRYQLLSLKNCTVLQDEVTFGDLGLAGTESHLQVIADRSLSWHPKVLGTNAAISEDGRTARRTSSFYEAIVFCAVPSRSCRIRIVE